MASKLYNELYAFDPGIADAFKKATNDNPNVVINEKGVDLVFDSVIKDRKITENEAKALTHLIAFAKFNNFALTALIASLKVAYDADLFFAGTAKRLSSAAELADVQGAINAVGNVDFWSPGSSSSYKPQDYLPIKELVKSGEITVYELKAAGFNRSLSLYGQYRSDLNRLVIFSGLGPDELVNIVVHEATHAIQDQRDLDSKMIKHTEADAFIAGAVANRTLKQQAFKGYEPFDTAYKAADLVIKGKAKPGDTDWNKAYESVVAEIKGAAYPNPNGKFKTKEDGEGDKEKKRYDDLMNALTSKSKP
ncbi:MAG: hypothetical protein HY040_17465 [Planctomycetes bacterium]|nr:hypothetical protein [Planctomycetota bacterium]